MWKDVKGYDGRYQVSFYGSVRSVYKSGKTRELTQYTKPNLGDKLVIKLSKDNTQKLFFVHNLVAQAFLGEPKENEVTYHANGVLTDNIATNIRYITREDLGRITGGKGKRQPVAKIDENGEIVEFYTSARVAAKKNYLSYQTVIDRCNGKVKSAFAPDGYAYAWEDCADSLSDAMDKVNRYRKKENVI